MAVKDGRLLEGQLGCSPFAPFETPIEQGSKASQKARKRTLRRALAAWQWRTEGFAPLPGRKASGRLLNGQRRWQEQPPAREKAPFAMLYQHGSEGRKASRRAARSSPICSLWSTDRTRFKGEPKDSKTYVLPHRNSMALPSKGSWSRRRQLLNCLPVKENRPLLMLRCLGRFHRNGNGRGRRIVNPSGSNAIHYIICMYIHMYTGYMDIFVLL